MKHLLNIEREREKAMMADKEVTFLNRESKLRSLLVEKPKNAKAISQLSTLLVERSKALGREQGQRMRDEGISLAKRAIQVAPQRPFGYVALSTATQDFSERMESLKKAASLCTDDHLIPRSNFLVMLLLTPREEEARNVKGKIGKASEEHPSRRDLNAAEKSLYEDIEITLERAWGLPNLSIDEKQILSKLEYRIGLFFRKKTPSSIHQLRARKHLMKSREHETGSHAMAEFWLGTMVEGDNAPSKIDKCPPDYIVGLYSTFASSFDQLLVQKLDYKTPTKLRRALKSVCNSKRIFKKCLDLGCGTGLSGLAFRDIVDELTGVDLSPEMIEKAKQRRCYESLLVGDIFSVFNQSIPRYDLVLACDVFCYIGNLSEVFASVSTSLSRNGYFCFSTEYLEDLPKNQLDSYRLQACARFAHKRRYVEELAQRSGFEVVSLEVSIIRKNQGENVKGMLAVLRPSALHESTQ